VSNRAVSNRDTPEKKYIQYFNIYIFFQIINENVKLPTNTPLMINTACTSDKTETDLKEKNKMKKLKEINTKIQLHLILLRKKNKILRSRIQTLENKIRNDKYKKALKKIFNEDQIKALFSKHQRTRN